MSLIYNQELADEVTKVCLEAFKRLPKTGKPVSDREWTLLACIVKQNMKTNTNIYCLEVVSLGTGSKCIGRNQLSARGDLLHDSHAEVIARRAFLIYLLEQIEIAEKLNRQHLSINEDNVENIDNGKCKLKPGTKFHFYTSHTPCGDASIFPKQEWDLECVGHTVEEYTGSNDKGPESIISSHDREPPNKKLKVENEKFIVSEAISESDHIIEKITDEGKKDIPSDINRTGAKVVKGEESDPLLPGLSYHTTGVLRTKPGRGDPTLSHSCSDKILKWNVLGLQGSILSIFIAEPIYLTTIIVGPCPYSHDAIYRAILGRFKSKLDKLKLPAGYKVSEPILLQSSLDFSFSNAQVNKLCSDITKLMPSPSALIWSKSSVHKNKQEVATNGRRLGITAKALNTPKSRVSICKMNLFQRSLGLLQNPTFINLYNSVNSNDYENFKKSASDYQEAWKLLKEGVLPMWTKKPLHLQHFKP
ncbi:unnamed protein product, partial [Meganyctiphanes norvegica]